MYAYVILCVLRYMKYPFASGLSTMFPWMMMTLRCVRARLVEAETAKSFQDDSISRASAAQEIKEQKSKDRMLPTDEELREGAMARHVFCV